MPYFARLDGSGRCVSVVEQAAAPQGAEHVPLGDLDESRLGRLYSQGQWGSPALTPPARVTMRQARLALLGAGLLDDVEAAINAIPDAGPRAVVRITWDHSQEVQRDNEVLAQLAQAIGLSAAQVDALFVAAAAL